MHVKSLQSCLTLCNPMDCILPGSSAMGFSRQEYWSVLPCPPPGDPPDPGIKLVSLMPPALAGGFFSTNDMLQETILSSRNQCNQSSPCDSFTWRMIWLKSEDTVQRTGMIFLNEGVWLRQILALKEKGLFSCQSFPALFVLSPNMEGRASSGCLTLDQLTFDFFYCFHCPLNSTSMFCFLQGIFSGLGKQDTSSCTNNDAASQMELGSEGLRTERMSPPSFWYCW